MQRETCEAKILHQEKGTSECQRCKNNKKGVIVVCTADLAMTQLADAIEVLENLQHARLTQLASRNSFMET